MEVNKEQAEKCRDLGATALRQGDYERAVKMLEKSLQLYPLPGVEALLSQAKAKKDGGSSESNGNPNTGAARRSASMPVNGNSNHADSAERRQSGLDGRSYTNEQILIVKKVLRAKEGGRGAHYRVLEISNTATESEIKKAYRKLSLKVHPDKNSAPHADEAFKAVGLAYATLSDPQKRTIYDRYGEEDPDNRGGGPGGMRRGAGPEMSPEEIFNAFFGGGMPGGPGVHFYSTGFGPGGVQFRAGGPPRRPQQRGQQQNAEHANFGMLMQLLPVFFFIILSFLSQDNSSSTSTGEGQYFSLVNKPPFTNPMSTGLSKVKDIPYFVSDKFVRILYHDRYQLSKVEHLVERAYENFLVKECKAQKEYRKRLFKKANRKELGEEERIRQLKFASEYELSRCEELSDLFPDKRRKRSS